MRRAIGEGLQCEDIKTSGGPIVEEGDVVRILYRVALKEKDFEHEEFLEDTYVPEQPIEVRVSRDELLLGVFLGLIGMRAGGSIRRLYLSPAVGYGDRPWRNIPPDSSLVIEVLVSLVRKQDADVGDAI